MKSLLLTNDDGFFSLGITMLKERLQQDFQVYIVAPDRERSAVSMALTLNHPLRIRRIDHNVFAVSGTTSDCVNIALQKILPHYPDFVVSGMNLGENISEDVFFSGTVGGAFAGFLYGIPSMAVSLIPNRDEAEGEYRFAAAADTAAGILHKLLSYTHGPIVYNVNIPYEHSGRVLVTRLGSKRYKPDVVERVDPRGRKYYWIGAGFPDYSGPPGTDVWAIQNGYVSLSVIRYDLNCHDEVARLSPLFDSRG